MSVGKGKMSRKGKIALIVSEGIVDSAYLDSVGVWTLGIGHTTMAGKPDPLEYRGKRMEIRDIIDIFEADLPHYESIVNRNLKVPVSQQQFDALVHFVYNVGEGNFKKSQLLRNLNNGKIVLAGVKGFHGWLKPKSLKERRDKESQMFLNGRYGPSLAPFYVASVAGRTRRLGTVDLEKIYPESPQLL